MWDVEFTDEFETWWDTLGVDEQQGIDAAVHVLEQRRPGLGRPLVDSVTGSRAPTFYDRMIPLADKLFDDHLAALEDEEQRGP